MFKLKYKKLHKDAKAPTRNLSTDLGFDVYSIEDYTLQPGEQYRFMLGIATETPDVISMNVFEPFPDNNEFTGREYRPTRMRIAPGILFWDKSSVGNKGVKVMGGVVEPNFRGNLSVMLNNLSNEPVVFTKGQKLCQMLVTPIILCDAEEVSELSETERGNRGFGSSGTH